MGRRIERFFTGYLFAAHDQLGGERLQGCYHCVTLLLEDGLGFKSGWLGGSHVIA